MQEIGSYSPENFFWGDYPIEKETLVVSAGETIKRHAPVKRTEDGTISPVTLLPASAADKTNIVPARTSEENTTAGLYGISAEQKEGGDEIAVYLSGEYLGDALDLEDGVTLEMLKPAFREIGIYLKEAQGVNN